MPLGDAHCVVSQQHYDQRVLLWSQLLEQQQTSAQYSAAASLPLLLAAPSASGSWQVASTVQQAFRTFIDVVANASQQRTEHVAADLASQQQTVASIVAIRETALQNTLLSAIELAPHLQLPALTRLAAHVVNAYEIFNGNEGCVESLRDDALAQQAEPSGRQLVQSMNVTKNLLTISATGPSSSRWCEKPLRVPRRARRSKPDIQLSQVHEFAQHFRTRRNATWRNAGANRP